MKRVSVTDELVFQELKQEIARAVELLNEKHEGANAGEARELLDNAKEAIGRDDYSQAIALAQKAQLAARPTTEYLLSKARSLENDGNQAYKEGDAVEFDLEGGTLTVAGKEFRFPMLPAEILAIRDAGGLIEYTRGKLAARG